MEIIVADRAVLKGPIEATTLYLAQWICKYVVAGEGDVVGVFTAPPTIEARGASDPECVIRHQPKTGIALRKLRRPTTAARPDGDELIVVEREVHQAVPLRSSNVLMVRIEEVGVGNELIICQGEVERFSHHKSTRSLYDDAFKANVMTDICESLRYTRREITDIRGRPGSRQIIGNRYRCPTHVGDGALKAIYNIVSALGLMVIDRYVVSNVEERTLGGVQERDDIRTNRGRV